jgi:hypothetical protein
LDRLEALPPNSPEYRAELQAEAHRRTLARDPYHQALQVHQQPLPHLIPKYEEMRQQVLACVRIDEAKAIADKVEALRAYARIRHDVEMELAYTEYKLQAVRRMGEISRDLEKVSHGPGRGHKSLPGGGKPFSAAKSAVLKRAGISTSSAHRYEKIAAIPLEKFERYLAHAREAHRTIGIEELLVQEGHSRRINGNMDTHPWQTEELFAPAATTPGWQVRWLQQAKRADAITRIKFILVLLASLGSCSVFRVPFRDWWVLVKRLIDNDQIDDLLQQLSQMPLKHHKAFFKRLMRLRDETQSFLTVDWIDITREVHEAEQERRPTRKRNRPRIRGTRSRTN